MRCINKVLIIGSTNSYNELRLVRSFCTCGIKPYGIIIWSKKYWGEDGLRKSKDWDNMF